MTTELDSDTLGWAAKWIEDSLKAETNERTIGFGRNMVMTLRAAKADTGSLIDSEAAGSQPFRCLGCGAVIASHCMKCVRGWEEADG